MNDFCRRCALIAASMLAVGCSHPNLTRAQQALCRAASAGGDNELITFRAVALYGEGGEGAIGHALFQYGNGEWKESDCSMLTNGRIADLLHAPHESESDAS